MDIADICPTCGQVVRPVEPHPIGTIFRRVWSTGRVGKWHRVDESRFIPDAWDGPYWFIACECGTAMHRRSTYQTATDVEEGWCRVHASV